MLAVAMSDWGHMLAVAKSDWEYMLAVAMSDWVLIIAWARRLGDMQRAQNNAQNKCPPTGLHACIEQSGSSTPAYLHS